MKRGVRDSFSLALGEEYEVVGAADGDQGVRLARGRRSDLVFLDLRMPGLSGVETLRRLHLLDPGIDVCIVTGFYEEYLRELIQAGEEGIRFQVARKPIDQEKIRVIAESHLQGPQVYPG
ncbi:MAG: response regulator transcription factor [Candidatus Sedimenticola endophacoides]